MYLKNLFHQAVTPEPDSTEDSTGGLDPADLPLIRVPGKSPTRRMSQPITGSPKDNDKGSGNRRASEGGKLTDIPSSFLLSFHFSGSNKYPVQRSCGGGAEDAEERTQMATTAKGMGADWATDASSFSHIFIPTSSSGDSCYLGIEANECKQTSGNRLKCVACRIVIHVACASSLNDRFTCRPSFCESVRKYREFTAIPHHWVQRKQLKVSCNIIFGNNQRLGFEYCLSSHVDI